MRSTVVPLSLALLVLLVVGCGGAPPAGDAADALPWQASLPGALARAGQEHKLVMVSFYTDWCGWCKKMDRTTYADGGVQRALEQLVLVRLDAERDGRAEADRFRVDSFPTIVFLDGSGREVARIPGYLGPAPFLEELKDILARG